MITPKNSAAAVKHNAAPAQQQQQQGNKILSLLASPEVKARFNEIMTDRSMTDRFLGVLNGAVQTTPKILECSEQSVMASLIKCANLRLEPNDPIRQQCFLIPRWNGKTNRMECSWEIGAKGLIELAYRSGEVQSIACSEIYERDIFDVDWGQNTVTHKLPKTERFKRGEVEAYWAQWIGMDGARGRPVIMSKDEMIAFMHQYVQSVKDEKTRPYSPWTTAFDQMALKTVIKRCLKTAPLSSEDLRNGLDESDPQDDARYAWGNQSGETSAVAKQYVHPLLASDEMYQHRTIDAEYDAQPTAPQPKAEPEPPAEAAAAPEPDQEKQAFDDDIEKLRLKKLAEVKAHCSQNKLTNAVILEKTGMPSSMLERATLPELVKALKQLQG